MQWYVKVLKQYFDFEGRARRKEYWMFCLFNILISFGIGLVFGLVSRIIGFPALKHLAQLYTFAVFIPGIAVGVRRAHDSNFRGWWMLVPFFNFYLLLVEGEKGPNRFGPDPKAEERKHEGGAAIV